MGFSFDPSFWYICRLCRQEFADTDKLKLHKLENHLGECLNIKCIVFEERLLDHEWIPGTKDSFLENLQKPAEILSAHGSNLTIRRPTRESCAPNPCVSLAKLISKDLHFDSSSVKIHSTAKNTNTGPASKRKQLSTPSQLSKRIKEGKILNTTRVNDEWNEDDDDPLIPKVEPQDPLSLPNASIISSSNSISDEDSFSDFDDVKGVDPEFILPVITPATDDFQIHQSASMSSTSSNIPILSNPPTVVGNLQVITENNNQSSTEENIAEFSSRVFTPNVELESVKLELEGEDYDHDEVQEQDSSLINLTSSVQRPHSPKPFAALWPFMCETCFAGFQTNEELIEHFRSHAVEKPFQCPHCPVLLKSKRTLQNHLILHGKVTPYTCKYCGKSLLTSFKLKNHERTHTGDRPYKCQVPNCDQAFSTKSAMNVHMSVKHSKELGLQQYICPISECAKSFGIRCFLNRHIQLQHGGEKPHRCTYEGCTKTYMAKRSLVKHLNMHLRSELGCNVETVESHFA